LKKHLIRLGEYNVWANGKICDFVLAAGEEAADMIQQSSFSTIRKTLYHIRDAETIWLQRLKGSSPADWPGKNFNGSLEEGCNMLLNNSVFLVEFIKALPPTHFTEIFKYTNLKGIEFRNTGEEIIAHVLNHSTYHRGQLVTMLRGAGFAGLESTDLTTFYRLKDS
jgi:uncharacterized damage-inducible protein DinB